MGRLRLQNAAQHTGIDLNDETISRISKLADAYSQAAQEAAAPAKTEQEAKDKAKELEGAGKDMAKGFVEDLAHAKSAAEALGNAREKRGEKMLDMGMDALWKSLMDNGGNGMFDGLAKAMTPAEKVVNAPGSSLADVKKLASDMKTANMSVTAGSVTVNGIGATGAGAPGTTPIGDTSTAASGTGSIGSDAKFPTTDSTPTGSIGGYADALATAGSISCARRATRPKRPRRSWATCNKKVSSTRTASTPMTPGRGKTARAFSKRTVAGLSIAN